MDPDAALDELLTLVDRMRPLSGTHLPPMTLLQDVSRILELIDALEAGSPPAASCLLDGARPADELVLPAPVTTAHPDLMQWFVHRGAATCWAKQTEWATNPHL